LLGEGPDVNERQLLKIAKALSDGTRLRLLREIAASGEISCGELASRLPVAQPTVSHHLKVLEEAGLVVARREGQFNYYRGVAERLEAFREALAASFRPPVPTR
jgi:DNA-binding transcriptional ArsR family regulator